MRELERDAERALRGILEMFPGRRLTTVGRAPSESQAYDIAMDAVSKNGAKLRFRVQAKSRVTPQTAISICERFRSLPEAAIPVVYAPTISPRVAQILLEQGVGYFDRAGNCWLYSRANQMLIQRQGLPTERRPTRPSVDPFATKSSRIVRALLSHPMEGWQVRQLAEHPDVQVSPGLVVKVKRALVKEGYAVERKRLLYLRDPIGLLNAWSEKYRGPAEQIPLYFRGDPAAAEQTVGQWCQHRGFQYALAGFSAAWRLAPEVRYAAGAVYVEDRGFDERSLNQLAHDSGGKRVETGPNLYLWRPFDRSVFTGSQKAGEPEQPVTSALQSHLDLKRTAGRGEEAAKAVFDKYLSPDFHAVSKREEERQSGTV